MPSRNLKTIDSFGLKWNQWIV